MVNKARNTIPVSHDGRMQPQATDLEEVVLGAMMLERESLSNVIDILKPEAFYKPAHQSIYRAILDLFNNSEPVDLLTVTAQLKKNGELDIAGGAYYISQLTNRVASSANVEYHSRIILQKSIQRELIKISSDLITKSYEDSIDIFDLSDFATQGISELMGCISQSNTQTPEELHAEAILRNEKILALKGGLSGISSGFRKIDDLTGGWQNIGLIVIAARPSMGKSALALDFMLSSSLANYPTALFSLEVSNNQVYSRLQAKISGIDLERITKIGLTDSEQRQMNLACHAMLRSPMFFEKINTITIFQFKNKARQLKRKHGVKLIIIDYLQLMGGKEGGNREQEISSITRGLKSISMELEIPIICLANLAGR